jgi:lysine decarboxylase
MASIDGARALLEHHGRWLLDGLVHAVAAARQRLGEVNGLHVLDGPGMDPTKLTVGLAGTGANGVEVESDLIDAGVPVEMADRDTIVAVVTVVDDAGSLERLTDVLTASIERRRGRPREIAKAACWIVEPEVVISPREAFFAETVTVPTSEAVGRVSADLIAPYPPGVPTIAPGELVTPEAIAALIEAKATGLRVAYATDPSLKTLEVLT